MELTENVNFTKNGWNVLTDDYIGLTSLPVYGPYAPTEEELNLLGEVSGKKVLDIGCGIGCSLSYMGDRGAKELWGTDISSKKVEIASNLLKEKGYDCRLFISPMEENPGLPENYFDIVYSIYNIGWTVDLEKTIKIISGYLKTGGSFIFSWDHPFMQCVSMKDGKITFDKSYHDENFINVEIRKKKSVLMRNWKLSSYINALSNWGLKVEALYEDVNKRVFQGNNEISHRYYSSYKGKMMPLSFIIKAVKL